MTVKIINLVTPNNLPIVGILREDGTVCEVIYTYDNTTLVGEMVLQGEVGEKVLSRNMDSVLVDSVGNEWSAFDILYDSISRS